MRLWATDTGAIVEYDLTDTYTPPTAYPRSFEFDEDTNTALARDILADITQYTIGLAGNLRRGGQLVTVNPGGAAYADRLALRPIIVKLLQDQDLTPAEDRVVLRVLLRAARRAGAGAK